MRPYKSKTRIQFYDSLKETAYFKDAVSKKRRNMFDDVRKSFLNSNSETDQLHKVNVLYGLRRTGKTYLMYQLIDSLTDEQKSKTAYIDINSRNSMQDLIDDLDTLHHSGYKYIFIDEATLMKDFIEISSILSDEF